MLTLLAHMLGEDIPVRADLYTLGGLSAHADRSAPRKVFVVHGEETVATGFAADLQRQFGWDAQAPAPGQSVVLD